MFPAAVDRLMQRLGPLLAAGRRALSPVDAFDVDVDCTCGTPCPLHGDCDGWGP